MANKSEDRQGMIFVGCIIIGAGVGVLLGGLTGNWVLTGACATIGVGLGFVLMAFVGKK